MHRQFLLGDESPHAPYVNYLKNQPRGRIPDEWTAAGKGLLQNILNHERLFDDRTGAGLPPGGADLKDYQDTWIKKCKGEDTELARAAYFQFSSRDEDTLSEFLLQSAPVFVRARVALGGTGWHVGPFVARIAQYDRC
jgi:hypothetical protein